MKNNLTIVIPAFNPNLEKFNKCVFSALKVNNAEIIIVDDNSNKDFKEYFDLLKSLEKVPRIEVLYNKKNIGQFSNSIYAISQAKTKYVKKLDIDDEIIYSNLNKIDFDSSEFDIMISSYKFKNKNINLKKIKLFNGSVIYNSNSIKEFIQNELLNLSNYKYFDDLILIFYILSNNESKILFEKASLYWYKEISSTTPKEIFLNYDLWKKSFELWKIYSFEEYGNKIINKTVKDIYTFNEILTISKGKSPSGKGYRKFAILPNFIKRLISNVVIKK